MFNSVEGNEGSTGLCRRQEYLGPGDLSWSCVYGVLKFWLWKSCNNQDYFGARTDMT